MWFVYMHEEDRLGMAVDRGIIPKMCCVLQRMDLALADFDAYRL